MFEGMRVVRVNTDNTKYMAPEGIRVGDTEQKVKLIHGTNLVVEPHQYVERKHYMIVKNTG
jgi:hypothetical protein